MDGQLKQSDKIFAGEGPYINLNVKLFLTDLGESGFQQSGKVQRLQDLSGNEQPAVSGERLYAGALKDFIINRRINQIELERVELISKKHEITDLTKLIVFSLLYRQFPRNLLTLLQREGFETGPLTEAEAKVLNEARGEDMRRLKVALLSRIKPFAKDSQLAAERDPSLESKSILSIAGKMINMLPLEYYRALLEAADAEPVMEWTVKLLREYLLRSRVSDYLSSAFLEWIGIAEKINLQKAFKLYRHEYVRREGKPFPLDSVIDLLQEDRKYRGVLAGLAEENRISLRINWKFGSSRAEGQQDDDADLVRLRLVNEGLIGKWLKQSVEAKINTRTSGKTIGDFYVPEEDDEIIRSGIGLLFTSFLKEACEKMNIDLFVHTAEDAALNRTTMTLTMKLNPVSRFPA